MSFQTLQDCQDELAKLKQELTREREQKQALIDAQTELKDALEKNEKKIQRLEISLETVSEHADLVEQQLLETQDTLETKVTGRTQELEEKNQQLKGEIGERKRMESALRQSMESAQQAREIAEAANRSKSAFLAKMSHELRTPLNAVIGYSEILEDDATDMGCEGLVPDLRAIKEAGLHLLNLINDVLDISKIEAERIELYPSEFDIYHLVHKVATMVTPSLQDNQLSVSCPKDIGSMCADSTRVQQILQNLLNNAIKFTQKGQIELSAKRGESSKVLELTVSDTGIGIAEEQLGAIFDAFNQADNSYTRKYDGMGIGLTICQQLCRTMGGEISVRSTPKKGSHFTVRLPLTPSCLSHLLDDDRKDQKNPSPT